MTTIGKLHYKNDSPDGLCGSADSVKYQKWGGDIYGAIRDGEITRYQFRTPSSAAGRAVRLHRLRPGGGPQAAEIPLRRGNEK